MADPYIWGNLNRAVNDPTLIDEAIAEAITAHDDDPDAHVMPGQSLESHRASEIIDHRAESVVNDKIRATARSFVAIVDPSSAYDFATIESAVQYAISKGGGRVLVMPGIHHVSRQIVLNRFIELVGIDRDSTSVIFDNGLGQAFLIKGFSTIPVFFASNVRRTSGSSSISFVSNETIPLPDLVGYRVVDTGATSPLPGYIVSGNYSTSVAMSVPQTTNGVYEPGYFSPAFDVVSGSNVMVLDSHISSGNTLLRNGYVFRFLGDSTTYTVTDFDGSRSFSFTPAYTGVSGSKVLDVFDMPDGDILLSNLNIDSGDNVTFQSSPILFSIGIGEIIRVEDVNLLSGGFVNAAPDCSLVIDKSICGLTSYLSDENYTDITITNSDIVAHANGVGIGYNTGRTLYSQSRFLSNGFTGHDWSAGTEGDNFIDGCLFQSTSMFNFGGNTLSVSNTRVLFNGTSRMIIDCANTIVVGCFISRLTLGASASKSIVSNCRFLAAPINNSTGSVLTGNINA